MAVFMGGQSVAMQRNISGNVCGLCSQRVKETPQHKLFECQELDQQRPTWGEVLRNMPPGMATCMETITAREKTKIILTAFGTRYCSEWTNLYACISKFVYRMYMHRKEKYDSLVGDFG